MGTLQGKKSRKETAPLHTLTMGYLAVMCSAFLLFPAAGGYERIGDWAYFLWRGLSLAYLVLLALTAAEVALTGGGRIKALLAPLARLSVPRICLLVYVGWSALAAWCSPYEGVWQGLSRHAGLSTILLYAAVFWAVSAYGRWDDRFLWALGAVTVFNAGIGLLQYAGYNPLGLFPEGTGYHDAFILYNGQFMGTLGNVDTLSAFLCLMVPLFYGAYLLSGRRLALIPMAAGIFTLGLAQVSSGFVGLAGAIVLTVPAYGSRPRCWIRGMEAAGVLALALGAATLLEADAQTPLHLTAGPVSLGLLVLGAAMAAAALWAARTWPEEPGPFRPGGAGTVRRRSGRRRGRAGRCVLHPLFSRDGGRVSRTAPWPGGGVLRLRTAANLAGGAAPDWGAAAAGRRTGYFGGPDWIYLQPVFRGSGHDDSDGDGRGAQRVSQHRSQPGAARDGCVSCAPGYRAVRRNPAGRRGVAAAVDGADRIFHPGVLHHWGLRRGRTILAFPRLVRAR